MSAVEIDSIEIDTFEFEIVQDESDAGRSINFGKQSRTRFNKFIDQQMNKTISGPLSSLKSLGNSIPLKTIQ